MKHRYLNYFRHTLVGMATLALVGFSTNVFAQSMGEAAESLMKPTEILTMLTIAACYVLGVVLIVMSIAQYKQHKQSPKLVPLTTPIMFFILGVCAVLFPFITEHVGKTGSATEQAKEEGREKRSSLPTPPPVDQGPGPGRPPVSSTPKPADNSSYSNDSYEEEYEDEEDSGDGSHWTDRY